MSEQDLPKWEDALPDEELPKWEDAIHDPHPVGNAVKAGAIGAAEGATLGLAPRMAALGETAMQGITGISGPLAGGSIADLHQDYLHKLEKLQREFARSAAEHPYIHGATKLGGNMATLGLAGPAAMSPAGLAGTGAVTGAAESTGDAADMAKAAVIGGATNLVAGTALNKVASAFRPPAGVNFPKDSIFYGRKTPLTDIPKPPMVAPVAPVAVAPAPQSNMMDKAAGLVGGYLGHKVAGFEGAAAGSYAAHEASKFARTQGVAAVKTAAHSLGDAVQAAPQAFGKYAKPLQSAAARGATSLAVTDNLLQQTDPNYQKHRDMVLSGNSEDDEE